MLKVWEHQLTLDTIPEALKNTDLVIMDSTTCQKFEIRTDVSQFNIENGKLILFVKPLEAQS